MNAHPVGITAEKLGILGVLYHYYYFYFIKSLHNSCRRPSFNHYVTVIYYITMGESRTFVGPRIVWTIVTVRCL